MENLKDRPLWQLTCEEFLSLLNSSLGAKFERPQPQTCTGVRALAENLACSEATIYNLKRDGVLDNAIVSHIGKSIVFDIALAKQLANAYKDEK